MSEAISWVTPLLILSTAARYEAVHAEIHELMHEASARAARCACHVVRRARLFRTALVSLYLAASAMAVSARIAAGTAWWGADVAWPAWSLLGIGVACILIATSTLARESLLSLRLIENHAGELVSRRAPAQAE